MNEELYFDFLNPRHVNLLKFLERDLGQTKGVYMCRYGEKTQHIFINNKYYMTINWSLV